MKQAWLKATLICGALDILYAMIATNLRAGSVTGMLTGIATGPLGEAPLRWGIGGAIAGLVVHFVLMGIIAAVLALLLRMAWLAALSAWLVGAAYGIGVYLVMYGAVMPARFGTAFPPASLAALVSALFAHIVLVGIPMAMILRRRASSART